MKVRAKRNVPQANKIFTDREEPRASFWKNYALCKQKMEEGEGEIKVLAYYGIGGIGKSTLLKKLQEEMREKVDRPKYVYFDFNIAQDRRSVLEYLKTKLSNDYKFNFPLFDLGIYVYAKKMGEDVSSPEIVGYIDKSPLLQFVVETMGAIPIASLASQVIKAADKGQAYFRNKLSDHRQELNEIEQKTPGELYDYLPYLFAQDIADNIEDCTEPLVFFLDTYERLVNEMSTVGEPLNNDIWIRGEEGLVQNIPDVLWVIAGREKLKWERFDVEWSTALDQHILGTLSISDADNYLRTAGIADSELRREIYDLTKGTPVYLDLCVDRYMSLVQSNTEPTIDMFGQNVYVLIERFARYMDDNRKDIVYMLSCMKVWNDFMIADIGPKVIPGFSLTTYEKVKDFSFVTKSDKYNFNIHQTVGDTLFNNCPAIIKTAVEKYAVEHCVNKLNNTGTFDPIYAYHLQWLVKFGLANYESETELIEYYNNNLRPHMKRLSVSGQAPLTEFIFEPIMISANTYENSVFQALALSEASLWKVKKGEYAKSVELAEKSVAIYEKLLGKQDAATLKAMHRLGERLRANGEYQRAHDVIKEVYDLRRSAGFEVDEEDIDVRDDYCSVMLYLGKYHEVLPIIEDTLELRKQLPWEEKASSYNTLWNLGEVYLNLGRYKEALPIQENLYQKSKELLGERHLGSINALSSLGRVTNLLGKYEEALVIRKKVLKLVSEILGEKHPDTVRVLSNLGVTLDKVGRYNEALSIRERVVDLCKELMGEKHPDTIKALHNLALTYSSLGRYAEALSIREQVLKLRKEVLDEKHPDTIDALNNLANTYGDLGRYAETLPLREQVLELRKEALGEKHPDTISALNNLAVTYSALGKYAEVVDLFLQVLELRKEVLGEKHPDTLSVLHNLANSYTALGQYAEAVHLNEDVLDLSILIKGEKHPDTILAMNGLAWTLFLNKQFDKGIIYSERMLGLIEDNDDIKLKYRLYYKEIYAFLLSETGNHEKAKILAKDLLQISLENFADNSSFIADRYYCYAYCLNKCGEYEEALSAAEKAYAMRCEAIGEDANDTKEAKALLDSIGENLC